MECEERQPAMVQPQVPGNSDRAESASSYVPSLHPWDGFLTGPENELAFAGAQALARGEREGISPLVVHGPSGVGKSRLLAGLVVEWLRRQPGATVAHLDAAEFAEACLEAARHSEADGWSELRARYRTVGLLVLDDLENLERAPLARDELIHTLDTLDALGAAVAVSCRSSPGQWPRAAWPARLVNRLVGGLAVRIDPPGLASRRRYILERARARGLPLSAEAIESLASTADGYRTLDGWLTRLALQARIDASFRRPPDRSPGGNVPVGPLTALELPAMIAALGEDVDLAVAGLTIQQITRTVAVKFGIRVSTLRGAGRQASVVEARHLAMHLARLHTGLSFAAIGAHFGHRDPATVRHACKAASQRLSTNPALAAVLASFSRRGH
jgi:chromosomal replication initiator protein